MIDKKATSMIQEFVHSEPRTIQEIAKHLNVNWKTAERYVERITADYGTLAVKQFRGSSKSSIKLVYWNAFSESSDLVQENLMRRILEARKKTEFRFFDVFQYCLPQLSAMESASSNPDALKEKQMADVINKTKDELLVFSGNLSWINFKKTRDALMKAIDRGVSVRIITRLDIATINNYKKAAQLSDEITIKHREQPLRGILADSSVCQMSDVWQASAYKQEELPSDLYVSYLVKDKKWIAFLRKLFFTMYNSAPETEMRVGALKRLVP